MALSLSKVGLDDALMFARGMKNPSQVWHATRSKTKTTAKDEDEHIFKEVAILSQMTWKWL